MPPDLDDRPGRASRDFGKASRFMALVLRHDPAKAGLTLTPDGWCDVAQLLQGLRTAGHGLSHDDLLALVAADSKGRYALSEDRLRIRANQGHSLGSVNIDHNIASPPPVLWHGTVGRVLEAIWREGLLPMRRHHVHLSPDRQTAAAVGARRDIPVVLRVDAAAMAAVGHVFRRSENHVWLVDAVPPVFLQLDALTVKRLGRAHLRQALYMPALVAIRFNADMKTKYQALVATGKPPKVAITAIMRKLLILANALLREHRNWTPKSA